MEKTQNEILFAILGDRGYIAGTDLDNIISGTKSIFPEISRDKITLVPKQEVPEEYYWSVRRVEEFRSWEKDGTYLLIKNFEKSEGAFRMYFPDVVLD